MELVPPVCRFGKLIILQQHVFRWVDGSRRFEVALCAPHIMVAQLEEAKVLPTFFFFLDGDGYLMWGPVTKKGELAKLVT